MNYILVTWPDSQELMDEPWFDEECILMNDEKHLDKFGGSAFLVPEERLLEFEASNSITEE